MTEKRHDDLVSGRLGEVRLEGDLERAAEGPESTYGRVRLGLRGVEAAPISAEDVFDARDQDGELLPPPSDTTEYTDVAIDCAEPELSPYDPPPPGPADPPSALSSVVAWFRYGRRIHIAGGALGVLLAATLIWTLAGGPAPQTPAGAQARSALLPPQTPPANVDTPALPEKIIRGAAQADPPPGEAKAKMHPRINRIVTAGEPDKPKAPEVAPAGPTGPEQAPEAPEPKTAAAPEVPSPAEPVKIAPAKTPKAAPAAAAATPVKRYRDPPTNLKLIGVVQTPSGRLATINGRMLAVGDTIEEATIISISDFSVEMELKGERFTLGMFGQ